MSREIKGQEGGIMDKYRIMVKGIVKYGEKYLVVKKWYDDRVAMPYQWQFIDGTIEYMEDPEKAVVRNVYEQTQLTVEVDRVLYTWSFATGDVFNIGIAYLCLASCEEVVISEELSGYAWIKREEFADYISNNVMEDLERTGQLPLDSGYDQGDVFKNQQ
jgi:8-oxo-dGTP pyrophosphatase MutT (NUDIX family)